MSQTTGGTSYIKYEDGAMTIQMTPPTPIGGWSINFELGKRFGFTPGSGFYKASTVSGLPNGASGIVFTNSGEGIFNVPLFAQMSGRNFGNYVFRAVRMDSGFVTEIANDYIQIYPN